ncbi:MAG TPA: hypothetical protein VF755_20520 [Catenuloplanes sp.]|jgi:hypothetical protein
MIDALAAEWVKFRTLRANWMNLAVVAAAIAAVGLVALQAAGVWDRLPERDRPRFSLAYLPEVAVWVAALALGILGVRMVTGEYASRMVVATFTAVPRRRTVLVAKALVLAPLALAAGLAAAFGAAAVTGLVLGDRPIGSPDDQLPTLLCSALVAMVYALVGLGVGAAMRSTAAGVAVLVALWHLLPVVVTGMLPQPWQHRVGAVQLTALGRQLAGADDAGAMFGVLLSPGAAAAMLVLWIVVPLALGAVRMGRGDA